MVKLAVTPVTSLVDEPVRMHISGVRPNQLVTIRASLRDEKGILFQSRAFYRGDAAGEIDLEQSESSGGCYQGRLPMGLFWALTPETPFHMLVKRDVIGSPFKVKLDVFESEEMVSDPDKDPVVSQTVERWYAAPGVQRMQIREGRVRGVLFLPPGDGQFPGVINMNGLVEGLTEMRGALLASRGFAALSLAFFAYEDLPSFLAEMDLEYFEEAAKLLLRHPKVLGPKVGVVGLCKGGEIALAMAVYLKQVAATVSLNGATSITGIPLRYGDVYIPGLPFSTEEFSITDSGPKTLQNVIGDHRAPEYEQCAIPLERAKAPILFIVGENDSTGKSKMFVDYAVARMRKHNNLNFQVLVYPGAGHLIEPPGSPFCAMSYLSSFAVPVIWGGELRGHCMAQDQSWQEILHFLQKHLAIRYPVVCKL
ncbi:acyl-coenzyme A amino acid N-acyltransferase 1-like [Ambystoma mexicanum]|uniref:acyl-coenzyme A amino acid N-acyltransferase 1-like n=1 Tax=Ambystoma mexicanum TaxID=8296 RepID=UPI0037E8FB75